MMAVNGLQEKFRDTGARHVSGFSKWFHQNHFEQLLTSSAHEMNVAMLWRR
jgi:hypothetical protein